MHIGNRDENDGRAAPLHVVDGTTFTRSTRPDTSAYLELLLVDSTARYTQRLRPGVGDFYEVNARAAKAAGTSTWRLRRPHVISLFTSAKHLAVLSAI